MRGWRPSGSAGGPAEPPIRSPARQTELQSLVLDVVVIPRCAVGSRRNTRADLDGQLLEVRALDRAQELQSGSCRAGVDVRLHVLDDLRDVGRELALRVDVRPRGRRD